MSKHTTNRREELPLVDRENGSHIGSEIVSRTLDHLYESFINNLQLTLGSGYYSRTRVIIVNSITLYFFLMNYLSRDSLS